MTDEPDVLTKEELLGVFAGGSPSNINMQNLVATMFDLVEGGHPITGLLIGTVEKVSGDGALDPTARSGHISSRSGPMLLTLVDGAEGQEKLLVMVVDGGGDVILTPDNYGNGDTLTFANVGDSAHLVFLVGSWWNVGTPTAVVGAVVEGTSASRR